MAEPLPTSAPHEMPLVEPTYEPDYLAAYRGPESAAAGKRIYQAITAPFIPLDWAVSKVGEYAIRPALEAIAHPASTKEELDMAQHGLEFVLALGLAPSYFRTIAYGVKELANIGRSALYKYGPDFLFKPGAMGGLPTVRMPQTEAEWARVNQFTKERLMAERATPEGALTQEQRVAQVQEMAGGLPETAGLRTTPTPAAGAAMGERIAPPPVAPTEAPKNLIHGTTTEAANKILSTGKFTTRGIKRLYDYSEWGPDAIYAARPDEFWFTKPEGGRAIRYEAQVGIEIRPDAKIRAIRTPAEMEKLANAAGFPNAGEMFGDLWVDNFNELRESTDCTRTLSSAGGISNP